MAQHLQLVSANTRFVCRDLGVEVDIRIRQLNGRWLAVADFEGQPEVGIGPTARAALVAALATLGQRAAAVLMADPQLLSLSRALRQTA